MGEDLFPFVVTVSAEQWANTKKRMAFLEAVLTQVMRDHSHLREWFSAKELAVMQLHGLPSTPEGITRKAAHHKWHKKRIEHDGRIVWGYHFSSLPNASFEAFMRRLIDIPDFEGLDIPDYTPPPPKQGPTPEWTLPLMRIIKGKRAKTWQEAYTLLTAESRLKAAPQDVERAFKSMYK